MDKKKKHIILFFLTAFLFLRIADVHSYSHFSDNDDEQIHCELCDIINSSNQFTPLLDNTSAEKKSHHIDFFPIIQSNFCYETYYYCITLPEKIYNKPPPFLS